MGKLIDGEWIVKSIITTDDSGAYDRLPRTFLDTIEDGHPIFQPELGRYHLYVSYACPWATRTLIYRQLKDLTDHISVSVVHPDMLEDGWIFDSSFPGATEDHLFRKKFLREIYQKLTPQLPQVSLCQFYGTKKLKLLLIMNLHKSFEFLTQHSTT